MRHQPHLHVPAPWDGDTVDVADATRAHLSRVLRYPAGAALSYTDGSGLVGSGTWTGSAVERGSERFVDPPRTALRLAVGVPRSKDRQRFVVEKAQELGVRRVSWLRTEHTQVKPPSPDRALAWAVSALEQSRGAWLMEIDDVEIERLDIATAIVTRLDGESRVRELADEPELTVVIGPEGGLTEAEEARFARSVTLGGTVLRTETAALAVAAALLL